MSPNVLCNPYCVCCSFRCMAATASNNQYAFLSERKTAAVATCPASRSVKCRITVHGFYFRRRDQKFVRRFRCLTCKKSFSDATSSLNYRQKKTHLNAIVFRLLCSGVSQRRCARIQAINRKTVVRKLLILEKFCTRDQLSLLANMKGRVFNVQFDDMETWEHTKLKPLSIPLAVEQKTRLIIASDVVRMPAKGKIARQSIKKYGKRSDHRKKGWKNVLETVALVCSDTKNLNILSDSNPHYPFHIRKYLPEASHKTVFGRRGCVVGQGELKAGGYDPLFSLNHTAAMYRANINRLFRRTWCTTKRPDRLLAHIRLYTTFHNRILRKH